MNTKQNVKPFVPNAPFLYPLKNSENLTGKERERKGKDALGTSGLF